MLASGVTLMDPQLAQSMGQAQVPSTTVYGVGPGLCPGNTLPLPQRWIETPLPSESMQTVWCWPPEKPTQDLVEFLKDVRF